MHRYFSTGTAEIAALLAAHRRPLARRPPEAPPAAGDAAAAYSATISPEPPNSAGKSFSLGSPSRIGRTVSA